MKTAKSLVFVGSLLIEEASSEEKTVFVFWTSKGDMPEQVYLTRFSLLGLSGDQRLTPDAWRPIGQKILLKPELPWEGSEQPLQPSLASDAVGVNELRDPAVFVDSDGKTYIFYTGNGEGAIGGAKLVFSHETKHY